jgi:hypothetical protein
VESKIKMQEKSRRNIGRNLIGLQQTKNYITFVHGLAPTAGWDNYARLIGKTDGFGSKVAITAAANSFPLFLYRREKTRYN